MQRREQDAAEGQETRAMATAEVERIYFEHQSRLMEKLNETVCEHFEKRREKLRAEMSTTVNETFRRHLGSFRRIERGLLRTVFAVLDTKYTDKLSHVQSIAEARGSALVFARGVISEVAKNLECHDRWSKWVDVMLAVIAIAVPVYFEYTRELGPFPVWRYTIPAVLAMSLLGVIVLKFRDHAGRDAEARRLTSLAAQLPTPADDEHPKRASTPLK